MSRKFELFMTIKMWQFHTVENNTLPNYVRIKVQRACLQSVLVLFFNLLHPKMDFQRLAWDSIGSSLYTTHGSKTMLCWTRQYTNDKESWNAKTVENKLELD